MVEVVAEKASPESAGLWRNRDYVLLWSGQVVSGLGGSVAGLAFPLLVLSLSHSPAQAGLVGGLGMLPFAVLGLPAGAVVDRWNRKRVMILCDTGRAITAASVPLARWLDHLTMAQIYLAALLSGTFFVFFTVAEGAALPRVVPAEQLSSAVAQRQATGYTTALLGPPLGGLLYQISRTLPFAADAVSYAASVLSLRFIRTEFQAERADRAPKLSSDITQGARWLWKQPLLRFMWFLNGGISLVGGGFFLMLILLARHQGATPTVIGTIFSLIGICGVLGSLLAPRAQQHFSFRNIIAGTSWIIVVLFPLFALAPNAATLGVLAAAVFFLMPACSVALTSYQLALIPDELRGRVNSTFLLMAFMLRPVGQILTGLVFQSWGPMATVLSLASIMLALTVTATLSRSVRNAPSIVRLLPGAR